MILTEVYLGLNGEWVEVSDLTVYPIEEILTLDETLDYGTMTVYTDQEDEYPRNTMRERLHFAFQIHYVSDSGIIIGDTLTAAFSETSTSQKRVVLLSKRISKFTQNLKNSEIIECAAKAVFDLRNVKISGLPQNGSGWAIVDEKNRIYLAESKNNAEIKRDENGNRILYCNLTI